MLVISVPILFTREFVVLQGLEMDVVGNNTVSPASYVKSSNMYIEQKTRMQ